MMQEPAVAHVEPEPESAKHMVHMLMQFALAVRHRKNLVIIVLVVSGLLCGLYYATAARYYSAKAGLVLQINDEPWSPGMTSQDSHQLSMLPTYQGLITCSEVVKGAIEHIPREHRVDFAHAPPDDWVEIIQSKLSVSNARDTSIVNVGFRSKDPNAAVTVVNTVVQSYQDFMDKTYKSTASEILEDLEGQMTKQQFLLEQKEIELARARERVKDLGISSNGQVLHPLQQRVVTLNQQYIQGQLRRQELEGRLLSIERAVERGEDLERHVLGLADVVDSQLLINRLTSTHDGALWDDLIKQRLEYQAKLEEMRGFLGDVHPSVRALQSKIWWNEQSLFTGQDEVKQRVARLQDRQLGPMLIDVVRQKLDFAWGDELSLKEALDKAEANAVGLARQLADREKLEHERDLLRERLDLTFKHLNDVDAQDEGQDVRVHIVDLPEVDTNPVSPSLARTILIALAGGLGIGLSLVYVLDILDDRFRSMEEMQTLLGVPVLAMVRELESCEETGIEALQTYVSPNATESEAFRTLRTALALAEEDTHQMVISSPEPGDGKTTVLANLAVAVAQSGKRTLLIDADLRRPGLTSMLGMRGIAGLSTVIRSEDDIVQMAQEHIRPSGLEGLDVLASGPRPANPAELLGSQRFSELLAWAESAYDQIFIDSPPTLATSDTAVIGRLTNAVLLVVQPAKNRRRLVMRSVDGLAVHKIPLLGVVVNRVGSGKDGSYYGYGYGGYYGYDYAYKYGGDSDDGEDELELDVGAVAGSGVSRLEINDQRRLDEPPPAGGIVPRRVA